MIDKKVRDETMRLLKCGSAAYYAKIKEVEKLYGTITRDEAAYVLAAESGVNLAKYLDAATRGKVMEIRSKPPAQSIVPAQARSPAKPAVPRTSRATARPATTHCRQRHREVVDCVQLHPEVRRVSHRLFVNGHYAEAVAKSFNLLSSAVKKKARLPRGPRELDGAPLMTTVLSPENPVLKLNALDDQSDQDEQRGYMLMAQGAIIGIRNPRAHDPSREDDPWRALELLVLASHLMHRVDSAKRVVKRRGKAGP